MNFVDFTAHKNNRLLTCTIQVTSNKSADGTWKSTMVFQLWTSVAKRLPAELNSAACFYVDQFPPDLVETTKLISHVSQIKFQGRSLEIKSQNINPLYMVVPCYISITVSQLSCHLYEMKEGHGVLPGGNWNVTFLYHAKLFQL